VSSVAILKRFAGVQTDADKVRNRGTRLLALALKTREKGHIDYSYELAELASETLAHAEDMQAMGDEPASA
jgi:hypothetical protein